MYMNIYDVCVHVYTYIPVFYATSGLKLVSPEVVASSYLQS